VSEGLHGLSSTGEKRQPYRHAADFRHADLPFMLVQHLEDDAAPVAAVAHLPEVRQRPRGVAIQAECESSKSCNQEITLHVQGLKPGGFQATGILERGNHFVGSKSCNQALSSYGATCIQLAPRPTSGVPGRPSRLLSS
jgi:hypothetical protein